MGVMYVVSKFTEACPKGPDSNIPAMAEMIAWYWKGGKPLFEKLMVYSLTDITNQTCNGVQNSYDFSDIRDGYWPLIGV